MDSIPDDSFCVDSRIIDDYLREIGPQAFAIYCLFRYFSAPEYDSLTISLLKLQKYSGICRVTVIKSIRTLVAFKLIAVHPGRSNTYEILPVQDFPSELHTPLKKRRNRPSWSRRRRQRLCIAQGYKCHYCGCDLTDENTQIDHMHPLSRGGSNKLSNLVAACRKCNRAKFATPYAEFVARMAGQK